MAKLFQSPKKKKTKRKSAPIQKPKTQSSQKPEFDPWTPPFHKGSVLTDHQIDISVPQPEKKDSQPQNNPRKEFLKTFRSFSQKWRAWDIWTDFVTMFACAISNTVDKPHYDEREKRYLDIIQKYSKDEQMLFPELAAQTVLALEENPEQDFLGTIYTELNLEDLGRQQIFTPYDVCKLMAKIAEFDFADHIEKKGYATIDDCCCGAGATLIAAVNEAKSQLEKAGINYQNHILVTGQDIDETVLLMCYIQLSLLGVAGYFKVGNSLTDPMAETDMSETYWYTPMYFSDVWSMRRIFHEVDRLTTKEVNSDDF